MNEELKIIIKAVTDAAEKNIREVREEVQKLGKTSDTSSKQFSGSMSKMGTAVKKGAAVAVTAIAAIATAIIALGKSSQQLIQEQAKLNTAFEAAGSTAAQAGKTYKDLFRFLGDSGKATEAANHLAKLTTNEKELSEWTTACQGIFATFGDSLPIEGLTEAANETAKVGQVTGTLADALNWAGVNEDAFNASLAQCSNGQERQALIRGTLNGLYADAAQLYEKNNAEAIAHNEAQAKLNMTLASVGKTITPLLTSIMNLANALLTLLAPAIELICKLSAWLTNALATAISWVSAFIGILTGSKNNTIASGIESAAGSAGNLTSNLNSATAAAEKLKRSTAGFDELNVMSSGGSAGGAGSGSAPGASTNLGSVSIDTGSLDEGFNTTFTKFSEFLAKMKSKLEEYLTLFTPTFEVWKQEFSNLNISWDTVGLNFINGFTSLKESFGELGTYVAETFIPDLTNSFNENFVPIFADIAGFAVEQFGKDFEWTCNQISLHINDIILPALEILKTQTIDTLDIVGAEWDKSGENLLSLFGGFVDSFKGIWENLYNTIIKPVWDAIVGAIDTLWENHLKGLWENIVSFFSKLCENVMTVWNNFLAPIVNWVIDVVGPAVVGAIESVISVVQTIIGVVADVVGGILKSIGGLLDFITGVFSGDWEKAWNGIKDFFKGIWDAIWGIVKGIVNLIIDGINSLWSGIYNAVKGIINGIGGIAGAIGDIFGKDWRFSMPSKPPLIPKLATGGIINSATIAMVGEAGKEAVLPLENNTEWMDVLAAKIASRQNAPSKIVLMLDKKELGWANINSINDITQQTGKLQLAFV